MNYRYFISYFETTNHSFGFGSCEVETDKKIENYDDINEIEEMLLEKSNDIKELRVLNYQLMKTIEKEVE